MKEHVKTFKECIADAREIIKDEKLMDMQSHVLSIATTLFNKRVPDQVHQIK